MLVRKCGCRKRRKPRPGMNVNIPPPADQTIDENEETVKTPIIKPYFPITSTKSKIEITDTESSVVFKQVFTVFKSDTDENTTAVYKFPLLSDAAVYYFKSTFQDSAGNTITSLIAKAKEIQKAREEYEQAKANGKTAQLLEVDYKTSPDVFLMSLGNPPEGCSSIEIEFRYSCPLKTEAGGNVRRFVLPTILREKAKAEGVKVENSAYDDKSNVYNFTTTPLTHEVNICLSSAVTSIECPSHEGIKTSLMIDNSPKKAKVEFENHFTAAKKDFILKVTSLDDPETSLYVQNPETIESEIFKKHFPDSTIAKLSLHSKQMENDETVKKHFEFLVDRSGSMGGSRMENCKKALQVCLSSLPENCTFDICSFGTRYDFLFRDRFKGDQPYNEDSLKTARDMVSTMGANMGGTNILGPLKNILSQKRSYPTVVFLLTDGQVGNTDAVVKEVKKAREASGTILFSCGIGSGVDRHLVEGCAKAGQGTATFIGNNEKMTAKMTAQMEQALEAPTTSLSLDMKNIQISEAKMSWKPTLPNLIYSGQRIDCFFVLPVSELTKLRNNEAKAEIALKGKVGKKDKIVTELNFETNFVVTDTNILVPAMKAQVLKAEDKTKNKKSDLKKALEFALCANIVSKYTSLVAVDETSGKTLQEKAEAKSEPQPDYFQMPDENMSNYGSAAPMALFGRGGGGKRGDKDRNGNYLRKKKKMSKKGMASFQKAAFSMSSNKKPGNPPRMRAAARRSSLVGAQFEREKAEARNISFSSMQDEADDSSDFLAMEETVKESVSLPPAVIKKSDDDILLELVGKQKPDGSFDLTDSLKGLLGVKDLGEDGKETSIATALVIIYLEHKLGHLKAEWKLVHKKASKWLAKNATNEAEILEKAKKHLNI